MTLELYANNRELVEFLKGSEPTLLVSPKSDTENYNTQIEINSDDYEISNYSNSGSLISIRRKKSVV